MIYTVANEAGMRLETGLPSVGLGHMPQRVVVQRLTVRLCVLWLCPMGCGSLETRCLWDCPLCRPPGSCELPQLNREILCQWSTLSYPGLVKELCALFIGSELIPKDDLNDLIDRAFSRFRHREVVHLSRLRNGLNVLELWHGVTYAFKDLSLSCTAQFLQYFLEKREKHVTVVVGTSGDTGSAAIESVQGAKNMDIIVLLPKGHCTKIQELQMTTVLKENVHVFGVEGNSDELDEPIKTVFADVAFVKKHNLMSLNSINWSRVLVQMAHHFFAYFQCTPSLDMHPLPLVEVVVPTGAAGNLVAGCIAQKIGLPIRLVVAVNRNDIIHRTVQQGDFSLSEAVKSTLASAMDIQVPYNMERVFWLLSGSDSQVTRALMEQFERTQSVNLPKELHSKEKFYSFGMHSPVLPCPCLCSQVPGSCPGCWPDP
ncbi:threonine synthase-like 2 isoform X8 [Nomascus leucogenys]|uniref:threonine synthase-like 2 isoform X8 n=1 Tax=Nomascus leucogenys TaxID=61853 RepID=UPI00122DB4E5|nr:threonine synthase-like 2 isoform X8 [Nomascus leucogenys]